MSCRRSSTSTDGENYHRKLLNVAVQEMGHLVTVQNLLLLLGGREAIYLQRDLRRRKSPKNPLPFILDPVSLTSLALYVTAEKPAEVPEAQRARVEELARRAFDATGVEPHRVGVIYAVLRWMFLPPEEAGAWIDLPGLAPLPANPHLSEADLAPPEQVLPFQAMPVEWQADAAEGFLLHTPLTLPQAVAAIDAIAEQGEGLTDCGCSHFAEFIEMADAFEAGHFTALPLAVSPSLGTGNGGERGEAISNDYTKLWGEIFSLHYTLLLLTIHHALVTPRPPEEEEGSGLRGDLIRLAFKSMRRFIGTLSSLVGALPLQPAGAAALAGPPYDLNPDDLPSDALRDLVRLHLRLLERLVALYSRVEMAGEFPANPKHRIMLANLRAFDLERTTLFAPPPPPPIV